MDTVPPFIPARVTAGFLHGRGACDTKGIIAAMLAAGSRLLADGISPSYLFVVGEETDSAGAKTAARSGKKAKYVVVGEPTENVFVNAHKGVLSYTLAVEGVAGHSGYPSLGHSAIHTLIELIQEIRNADWGASEQIGLATTNIGVFTGGVAPNVLAPKAEATIVHRIIDSADDRLEQVRRIVGKKARITLNAMNNPQRMHVPFGVNSISVSFGTDVPYVREIGVPLLIGPGSIHDAHTPSEKISLEQLRTAVNVYHQLYETLQHG
jgi:acetylornithine deacetylase